MGRAEIRLASFVSAPLRHVINRLWVVLSTSCVREQCANIRQHRLSLSNGESGQS